MPLEISRGLLLLQTVSDENGSMADLRTLTDHPRFSISSHKVSNSEARVLEESVLESMKMRRHGASCRLRNRRAPANPRSLSCSS
jgi:hypothetical protein